MLFAKWSAKASVKYDYYIFSASKAGKLNLISLEIVHFEIGRLFI